MAYDSKMAELRCFGIFWEAIMGERLGSEALAAMRNPNDPPDFCFNWHGSSIALEHTHIFRGGSSASSPVSPFHSLEIERRVCKLLEGLLRKALDQIPAITVLITFTCCRAIRRSQEESIAVRLFELIRHKVAKGRGLQFDILKGELAKISSSLESVLVMQGTGLTMVTRSSTGGVDEWGLPEIEAAARTKAEALARYNGKFDQRWLVLGAGGAHREQWIEPCDEACAQGISTEFDRVFLVDESGRKVYEIQTQRMALSLK